MKARDFVATWGLAGLGSPTGRTPEAWGSPEALIRGSTGCVGGERNTRELAPQAGRSGALAWWWWWGVSGCALLGALGAGVCSWRANWL